MDSVLPKTLQNPNADSGKAKSEVGLVFSGEFLLLFFFPVVSDISCTSFDKARFNLKRKIALGLI